jgi:hypothetical protein
MQGSFSRLIFQTMQAMVDLHRKPHLSLEYQEYIGSAVDGSRAILNQERLCLYLESGTIPIRC